MSILRNATLQEIESYGSSVQVGISDSMSKIMFLHNIYLSSI